MLRSESMSVEIDPDTFSILRNRANVLGMGVKDFIWCSLAYELGFHSESQDRLRKSIEGRKTKPRFLKKKKSFNFEIGPDLLPKLRKVAASNGFSAERYALLTLEYEIGFWAELGYSEEFKKAISDAYDQGLFDED